MTLDGVTARDDEGRTLDITTSKRPDALSMTLQTKHGTRVDFHLSRYYARQVRDRLNRFLETDKSGFEDEATKIYHELREEQTT